MHLVSTGLETPVLTRPRLAIFLLFALLEIRSLPPLFAQSQPSDLSTATLEDLTQMHISFSSFARKDEDLWKTPAAVFVITREDIANSTMSSVPDLLRTVPGLQVAQINASNWAVSARGFNSIFANKLLVLVDGRTLYSEIYSGSHWDQIDLPLEYVERIEVIRGPGAAVWGTNAVNGVINIITRKTRATLGFRTSGEISRINQAANLSYGGTFGQHAHYRLFAGYLNRSPFEDTSGRKGFDGEDTIRGGGRLDWQPAIPDSITVNGDLYGGHVKQQVQSEIEVPVGPGNEDSGSIAGGYLLGRWEHKSARNDEAFQAYFDDQSRHELGSHARVRTVDLDYQDHRAANSRNDLVWGGEFRYSVDHLTGSVLPTTAPNYRNYLSAGFFQDDVAVIPARLTVTLGSKIQYGTLAGFQIQPSIRVLWAPDPGQSIWAAVSRAAVAPSIQDKYLALPLDLGVDAGISLVGSLEGDPTIKPETVTAYEGGYRRRLKESWTIDIAGFLNQNRRFQSLAAGPSTFETTPVPEVFTPLTYINGFRALSCGLESAISWKPNPHLSLQAAYTWIEETDIKTVPDAVVNIDSWSAPRNAGSLSALWSVTPNWRVSSFISHVDTLPGNPYFLADPEASNTVPSYTRLDLQLTRDVGSHLSFKAGGTSLLTPRHWEFGSGTGFSVPYAGPRSAFLKATWSF